MTVLRARARAIRCVVALSGALLMPACSAVRWVPGAGDGGDDPAADFASGASGVGTLELRAHEQPEEPYWPFRIAEIRAAEGDAGAAEGALQAALLRDPTHAPSLALLSKIWFDEGRHEEAIATLESAREVEPLPRPLALALAVHYDAIGAVAVADSIAESVEPDLEDWPVGGSALTYVRLRGDGFQSSEEIAAKALRANDSAVNHNNYGIAKLYAGEPELAREHFLKANEKDPALPGPLYNLAIVDRFYRFDDEGARRWFARYRQLADDDPDGLEQALQLELAGSTEPEEEAR